MYINRELKMKTLILSTIHTLYTQCSGINKENMKRILTNYEQQRIHKKIWKLKNIKN